MPDHVKYAILTGDKRTLSALGRKGAAATKKNRELKEEKAAERLWREFDSRARQANEHLCPIH
ncbi:MAG TPA: hypothetical protein VGO63_01955 [Candidatus Paceibacterota bacterium]|nr:hypothetical protein [Candidatus Paceibacterota bacterium]